MSARVAQCPSCGASIEFAHAASVMVVCAHCSTASLRRGVNLESMGKLAEVAPVESALSLGAAGKVAGRRFEVIGLVQLDHGLGPWNEWCLLLDGTETAWLAEAQGERYLTSALAGDAPEWPLESGTRVEVAGTSFLVAETGRARIVTARGELPDEIAPGATYAYADLRGPDRAFATVARQADGTLECFVGRRLDEDELSEDRSTAAPAAERRVGAERIGCPSCGSAIDLRDPENTVRVVCGSCGSLLDPTSHAVRVVDKAKRLEARPVIPIGSRFLLRGQRFEVLGYLVRSVRVDGVRYPWAEYLLRRADGGYRWLVCSSGHWTLTEPADAGDVTRSGLVARYRGEQFRHFQGGDAVVDHVQGEAYWEIRIGETVHTDDFVAPPRMVSFEESENELVCSLGHYVERDEMQAALPTVQKWPWPRGVAPNQPNPWIPRRARTWRVALVLAAAVVALLLVFRISHANREVARVQGESPPAVASGAIAATASPASAESDPGVVFSDEFRLEPSLANVAVKLVASVSNQWVGIDGALVNLDTGDVRAFALEAERWSGVADGESWSEGDGEGTTYLGSVPAGRYALRLDAEAAAAAPGAKIPYTVTVRSQVPSTGRAMLLLVLYLVAPVFVTIAAASFESRRWSESDHAGGSG